MKYAVSFNYSNKDRNLEFSPPFGGTDAYSIFLLALAPKDNEFVDQYGDVWAIDGSYYKRLKADTSNLSNYALCLETYLHRINKVSEESEPSVVVSLRKHKETIISEAEATLFVSIEDTLVKAKPIVSGPFHAMLYLGKFGDFQHWPDIFLGNCSYGMRIHLYDKIFSKMPETTDDLFAVEVTQEVLSTLSGMRNYVQTMLRIEERKQDISEGARVLRERREEAERLQRAGKDFIKNNKVDYGNETVEQIAKRLNISKGEVRRRKQNNEL